MKRIFLTFTMAMLAILSFAQIPQTFSYQAVIRDAENNLVVSQPISLELSILQGSDEGKIVYNETHWVSTNSNGLLSVEMGAGYAPNYNLAEIDWSNTPYFIKTVVEYNGKQISGVTPLLSVPYALYAEKAGSADVDLSDYALKNDIPTDYVTSSTLDGYIKKSDIDLSDYALKNEIPTDYVTSSTLNDYAKKTDILEVDLSGYYTKAEIEALLKNLKTEMQRGTVVIENGAIKAAFSVSDSKQVYFSRGNLQYQASTGIWRFAEKQWIYVGTQTPDNDGYFGGMVNGSDNADISSTYRGWIDLFCWGTSGWNSGANECQPYSTSGDESDYYPGGSYSNNLTDSYANADWGVYNKISNGGNHAEMWRTLTKAEWKYLIYDRANARQLQGQGNVNNVYGLILLPDDWETPSSVKFTYDPNDYSTNVYSQEEWTVMQSYGAVFLPAAGQRFYGYRTDGYKTVVDEVGSNGYYWSSSAYNSSFASVMAFFSEYKTITVTSAYRSCGQSVRLVQDVK